MQTGRQMDGRGEGTGRELLTGDDPSCSLCMGRQVQQGILNGVEKFTQKNY